MNTHEATSLTIIICVHIFWWWRRWWRYIRPIMYNISAYIERRRDRSYAFRKELPSSRVDSLLGLIYSPQPSAERYARRCNFKVHGLCRLIRQSYYLAAVTNLHHSSSSKRRDPSVSLSLSTFNKAQTWAQNCINLFACQNYWCRPSTARVSPAFSAVPFPHLPFFSYLPMLVRLQRLVEGALFNAENGMLPQCKGKGCDLCRGSDDRTPTVLVIFFFFNGPELSCSVFELKEEAFRHRGSSSPGRAVGVTSKYWCKEATPKERKREREGKKSEKKRLIEIPWAWLFAFCFPTLSSSINFVRHHVRLPSSIEWTAYIQKVGNVAGSNHKSV